jgi:hypothetical protein
MNALRLAAVVVLAGAVALGSAPGGAVRASDHGDSPSVRVNPQLDIGDLYVFASPQDPARTIFILTVSPLAGLTGPTTFASRAQYNVNVDVNGDLVEDDVHTFTFTEPGADGRQTVTVSHRGRGARYKSKGLTGQAFQAAGGTRVHCGLFDDPFYFDLVGFRAGNAYSPTGSRNFFRDLNTLAIVFDVANAEFGPNQGFRVWANTVKARRQVDRAGRPGVNSILVPAPRRDEFNAARPRDDRRLFKQDVMNRIITYRNGNQTGISEVADAFLPDVLPYAPGATTGFAAGNGRRLTDDPVDHLLNYVTAGRVATDHVASDSPFLTAFPFLAPANP